MTNAEEIQKIDEKTKTKVISLGLGGILISGVIGALAWKKHRGYGAILGALVGGAVGGYVLRKQVKLIRMPDGTTKMFPVEHNVISKDSVKVL